MSVTDIIEGEVYDDISLRHVFDDSLHALEDEVGKNAVSGDVHDLGLAVFIGTQAELHDILP